MKIEVGKFYKTKAHEKVRIYALDGEDQGVKTIHGAVLYEDRWISHIWVHDGRNIKRSDSHRDIISEWDNKSWKGKAWIDLNGVVIICPEEVDNSKYSGYRRANWLDEP